MWKKLLIGLLVALLLALAGGSAAALAEEVAVLTIDIKPCKEPNVLNVNQPGELPVAIYAGDGIVLNEINVAAVTLEGVPAISSKIKGDYLLVKFDPQAVIAVLGDVSNGQVITLTLNGVTFGGTLFTGQDEVVILKRVR